MGRADAEWETVPRTRCWSKACCCRWMAWAQVGGDNWWSWKLLIHPGHQTGCRTTYLQVKTRLSSTVMGEPSAIEVVGYTKVAVRLRALSLKSWFSQVQKTGLRIGFLHFRSKCFNATIHYFETWLFLLHWCLSDNFYEPQDNYAQRSSCLAGAWLPRKSSKTWRHYIL